MNSWELVGMEGGIGKPYLSCIDANKGLCHNRNLLWQVVLNRAHF